MTKFKDALDAIGSDKNESYLLHLLGWDEVQSIRLALRIAQAVTEEPTKTMWKEYDRALLSRRLNDGSFQKKKAFRAMIEQMMKELE